MTKTVRTPPVIAVAAPKGNVAVFEEVEALTAREAIVRRVEFEAADAGQYATDFVARIEGYLEVMPELLGRDEVVSADVVALGHTGMTYVAGRDDSSPLATVMARSPVAVVTAADAMQRQLSDLGATRIALFSPYPEPLHELALTYWSERGLSVVHQARMEGLGGSRSIYTLRPDDMKDFLVGQTASCRDADVVVLSGTGAPTLSILDDVAAAVGVPVVSANKALALVSREVATQRAGRTA